MHMEVVDNEAFWLEKDGSLTAMHAVDGGWIHFSTYDRCNRVSIELQGFPHLLGSRPIHLTSDALDIDDEFDLEWVGSTILELGCLSPRFVRMAVTVGEVECNWRLHSAATTVQIIIPVKSR